MQINKYKFKVEIEGYGTDEDSAWRDAKEAIRLLPIKYIEAAIVERQKATTSTDEGTDRGIILMRQPYAVLKMIAVKLQIAVAEEESKDALVSEFLRRVEDGYCRWEDINGHIS